MQSINELTPNQLTFLDWVTRGHSIEDAAKEVEVRWSAVMEWKRNTLEFQQALDEALECRALLIRERAHSLIYEALDVLQRIVQDTKASPSIRLRASLALIKMSVKPVAVTKVKPASKQQPQPKTATKSENVHNPAQVQPIRSGTTTQVSAEATAA